MKSFAPQLLCSQFQNHVENHLRAHFDLEDRPEFDLSSGSGPQKMLKYIFCHVHLLVTSKDRFLLGITLHSTFESWRSACDGAAVLELCIY